MILWVFNYSHHLYINSFGIILTNFNVILRWQAIASNSKEKVNERCGMLFLRESYRIGIDRYQAFFYQEPMNSDYKCCKCPVIYLNIFFFLL